MTSALDAALGYAKMGLAVFPVRRKSPIPPNGFKDASTDPAVIKAWWASERSSQWGVAIRIPDWAVVADVDTVGYKSLEVYGHTLPSTPRVQTKRGHHWWYELPKDIKSENMKRKVGYLPDVDLLIHGYVMAPPSPHPEGGKYQWDTDVPFKRDNIEKAPPWIVTAIMEERAHHDKMTDEDFLNGLPVGKRQEGLFRRACRLRHKGNTKGEAKAVLRELAVKSGSADYDTDKLVERVWKTYEEAAERKDQEEESKIWNLADLLEEVTEPPEFLVEDLLPCNGYTLLHAPQGIGKSALAQQVAIGVATGGTIFGRRCERAGVLVLDLEQDDHGAADRWRRLLSGVRTDGSPSNVHVCFSWNTVDAGGLDRIANFLIEHPHVRLVIIDTLGDMWPASEGESSNAYNREVSVMKKFVKLARDYGVALLVAHHDRKGQVGGGAGDTFSDRSSGTRAIPGKAKARWSLQRKDFEENGTLEVSGKNVPSKRIALSFDAEKMTWR